LKRALRLLTVLLLAGCATTPSPRPVKPEPKPVVVPQPVEDRQAVLRELVQRFVAATESKHFEEVLPLLAKPLRERYSVEKLERDFGADPLAVARLAQIKAKAGDAFVEAKDSAALEWAQGRALKLVQEPDGWRIASLE
jgi:hypothetical protein